MRCKPNVISSACVPVEIWKSQAENPVDSARPTFASSASLRSPQETRGDRWKSSQRREPARNAAARSTCSEDGGRDHGDEASMHGVRTCVEGAGQAQIMRRKAWKD